MLEKFLRDVVSSEVKPLKDKLQQISKEVKKVVSTQDIVQKIPQDSEVFTKKSNIPSKPQNNTSFELESYSVVKKKINEFVYPYRNLQDIKKPFFKISEVQKKKLQSFEKKNGAGWPPLEEFTDCAENRNYNFPQLYNLSHDDTNQNLFEKIMELPTTVCKDTGHTVFIPQIKGTETTPPYFLKPDKDDTIVENGVLKGVGATDPFDFKGVVIHPSKLSYDKNNAWYFRCAFEDFKWCLSRNPANPATEWLFSGVFLNGVSSYNSHPDNNDTLGSFPWDFNTYIGMSYLRSEYIYPNSMSGVWKKLGFFGALSVCINWATRLEKCFVKE